MNLSAISDTTPQRKLDIDHKLCVSLGKVSPELTIQVILKNGITRRDKLTRFLFPTRICSSKEAVIFFVKLCILATKERHLYKGFFLEKMGKCLHIMRENGRISPYLDNWSNMW
jgi:hypothetical protein